MATLGSPVQLASLRELEPLHNPKPPSTTAAIHVNNGRATHFSSSSEFFPRQWHPMFSSAVSRKPRSEETSNARFRICASRGKGFGDLVKRTKPVAQGKRAAPNVCPCGGGKVLKEYGACCGPFHGGVVEPDALTLMKARFSAYSLGVVPYVVRTTHPDNPAFEGAEKLAEDVRATCARLRFFKLDIVDYKEVSESEAFVSFVAHYTVVKGGRGGERKQLKEESRFVKEAQRWLYIEGLVSQASEAAWLADTTPNFVEPQDGRKDFAQPRAPVAAQASKTRPPGS